MPMSVSMAWKDEPQNLLFPLHPLQHLRRCTREAQMPPVLDLGSEEEEGSLVQHGVATTSFSPRQRYFFQPASLERVCHPPQLVVGMMHTFEILK